VAFTALYDAYALYPAPIRDVLILMHLALTDVYRARWTNEIHEEWVRTIVTCWPQRFGSRRRHRAPISINIK
jgi:hypothetical protein